MADFDMDENDEAVLAEEIMDGRKCANTKIQYGRKVDHFKKWVREVHPECLDVDTTVNLQSIEKGHLKHFFGHICKKKKPCGDYIAPVVYQTFQYVSGYKSALKDFFSNNNVKIPNDAEKMMEQFFKGYNRKIAQMKQD